MRILQGGPTTPVGISLPEQGRKFVRWVGAVSYQAAPHHPHRMDAPAVPVLRPPAVDVVAGCAASCAQVTPDSPDTLPVRFATCVRCVPCNLAGRGGAVYLAGRAAAGGSLCRHHPCKIHTVCVWRTLQGGLCMCRHPSVRCVYTTVYCVSYPLYTPVYTPVCTPVLQSPL